LDVLGRPRSQTARPEVHPGNEPRAGRWCDMEASHEGSSLGDRNRARIAVVCCQSRVSLSSCFLPARERSPVVAAQKGRSYSYRSATTGSTRIARRAAWSCLPALFSWCAPDTTLGLIRQLDSITAHDPVKFYSQLITRPESSRPCPATKIASKTATRQILNTRSH
jgi:hypothetical protein